MSVLISQFTPPPPCSFSINSLSNMCFANVFSNLIGCLFTWQLVVFFAVQKLFSLTKSHLFVLLHLLPLLLVSNPRNHCQDPCQGSLTPFFFFQEFNFNFSLTFNSLFKIFKFQLIIFGCSGSLLLCMASFSSCGE